MTNSKQPEPYVYLPSLHAHSHHSNAANVMTHTSNNTLPEFKDENEDDTLDLVHNSATPAQGKKPWTSRKCGGTNQWTPYIVGGIIFVILLAGGITAAVLILHPNNSASTDTTTTTSGLSKDVGNCVSGSYPFSMSRVTQQGYNATVDPSVNPNTFDFIMPYGLPNVKMSGGVMKMSLTKSAGNTSATGALLTTSRYMLYGRYSVTIQAINRGGAITDVISLSDEGDEIDVEICGAPVAPYTNIFFNTTGKPAAQHEYFGHYDIINGIDMASTHTYTVDWKHDSLTWIVDGKVVRTVLKSNSTSLLEPNGPKWFPVTPSLIQFGVWDASFSSDPRTVQWAG